MRRSVSAYPAGRNPETPSLWTAEDPVDSALITLFVCYRTLSQP
jgi:hypothetical protein